MEINGKKQLVIVAPKKFRAAVNQLKNKREIAEFKANTIFLCDDVAANMDQLDKLASVTVVTEER